MTIEYGSEIYPKDISELHKILGVKPIPKISRGLRSKNYNEYINLKRLRHTVIIYNKQLLLPYFVKKVRVYESDQGYITESLYKHNDIYYQ